MPSRPGRLLLGAAILSIFIAAAAFWDAKGLPLLRKLDGDAIRQEASNAALREDNARLSRRGRQKSGPREEGAPGEGPPGTPRPAPAPRDPLNFQREGRVPA